MGFQFPVAGFPNENCGFSVPGFQFSDCGEANPVLTSREISKQLTKEWPQIRGQVLFLGRHLTKWNLVKAIGILSEARKSRFLRSKRPKYGSMNKGFREEELERFFSVIDDQKMHLLFSFQAILGLRVGEAIRVNVKDINLRTRELRIFTEKSGKTDYLLIPEKLFEATLGYIGDYENEIAASKGYLFFSIQDGNRKKGEEPHITSNTVRKAFREYARKARLEEIYGYSSSAHPYALRRLSPHSLRHYAITNFARKNNGNVMLASKFARHTDLKATMIYIHTEKEELYGGIERAHDNRILERVQRIQEGI